MNLITFALYQKINFPNGCILFRCGGSSKLTREIPTIEKRSGKGNCRAGGCSGEISYFHFM
jgi:hypothetical protein